MTLRDFAFRQREGESEYKPWGNIFGFSSFEWLSPYD